MHAAILERNKLVGRRVARVFAAVGAKVTLVEDPGELIASVADADVVCGDSFDGELIAEQVRARPGLRGVLWTAEPLRRSLKYLAESSIDHVLARRDFESPPRAWEAMLVARRLAQPELAPPPATAYMAWGAEVVELPVRGTADRDSTVARVQELVRGLQVPNRFVEMIGELAHELIMNAVYGAPTDAGGRAKYAADRKASIELAEHERPTLRFVTDGALVALQMRDPFGRLERRHVIDGLTRGLAGEVDRSHGGAGLGFSVCHNASTALIFEVARDRDTSVTALCELDANMRELRGQAKSLHWWAS
jgi:hypothetical protein